MIDEQAKLRSRRQAVASGRQASILLHDGSGQPGWIIKQLRPQQDPKKGEEGEEEDNQTGPTPDGATAQGLISILLADGDGQPGWIITQHNPKESEKGGKEATMSSANNWLLS